MSDPRIDRNSFYLMSNIPSKRSGLPFTCVWIAVHGGAAHEARVWVSKGPTTDGSNLIAVAIIPEVHVVGDGEISAAELVLLRRWVEINRDVIVQHWTGEIPYSEDALNALKPIIPQ